MRFKAMLAAAMLSAVAACGGGGGSGGSTTDPSGQVSITATGPTSGVPSGGQTRLDVTVANTSTSAVANVAAQLSLPAGVTRDSVTCSASAGAACPTDASTMAVASLPAGASLHYVVLATVTAGTRGALTATASVTANGAPASAADQVAITLQAFSADIRVSGQAPAGAQTSGHVATYTMTVTNAGPDTASNVALQESVDSHQALGTVACAAQGGATCPATLGATMTAPTLPVGGSLVFTVPATIAANTLGNVTNTMTAAPDGDPAIANNVATATAATTIDPHGPASFITLQSDAGDYIGAGGTYAYTSMNASLVVTSSGAGVQVSVNGDDTWNARFALPGSLSQLQPGTYANLTRFGSQAAGAIDWWGDGRGCNEDAGTLTIDNVTYAGSTITSLDMRFEQHCEGGAPALRGQIHWLASDNSKAPGPVNPVPASLWRAPAGATPATGNYVYLQGDAGAYVGGGLSQAYTQANAVLGVTLSGTHVGVNIQGNDSWFGDFQGMNSIVQLQPGYYSGLRRYPFSNPATGGLSWYGDGAGCNTLTGWFAVDNITITNGALAALDLRFEQHCEGATAALHGQIHWVAGDTTAPAGPQSPPPATLWRAAAGATPASGNYVYLQSDSGDYIGGGATSTYTQADAVLSTTVSGTHLQVGVQGNDSWSGDFQGMSSIAQLRPGYYPGLQRFPFNNPVAGGLSWTGNGRGCNTLTGWFVIDDITWSGATLASVDLRFEQHCEGGTAALHGQIHWAAGDTTAPPGPQNPMPAGLWTPPAGATPASGNYVYLQSDAGDYIGQGVTEVDTLGTGPILVSTTGNVATVSVGGWGGEFAGMNSIAQLRPGYYGGLQRYPFNNAATGGLSWDGNGRGCNTLTGWFAIDAITYSGGAIASLDLRFEQHCEGGAAALHGQVHWVASDPTVGTVPGGSAIH